MKDLKRLSKPSFPGYFRDNMGHHSMMFTEDLSRYILKNNTICSLSVENETVENLIPKLFSHTPHHFHYRSQSFNESVRNAIQLIVNNLVHNGRIVFEFISETNEGNDDLSYKLVEVKGEKLKINLWGIKQVSLDDNGKKESTIIPKNKCIVIDFPEFLGGRKKHIKFLDDLKALSDFDPIHLFTNKLIDSTPNYDPIDHHKKQEIELRRKSKPYKWHHRDNLGNNDLFAEYYNNLRTVEFMKTRAQLRDYAIDELNKIIKFVCRKIGEENIPTLEFENLISIKELDKVINDYRKGKVGRNKIIELISKV